ncbi:class I SAM-dependent methyltransferase [Desulfonema magnum]|nr:class I SAM-dependent methyltransferase [Desulfonema magnum]
MEKIKTSVKKYWNWRSKSFGYDTDKSVSLEGRWESVLRELVSGTSGRRALDIGTGTGQFAVYLARSGFDVTGIDISEEMISLARRHAMAHQLDIDFRTGDAEQPDFEDNTFDVVVSRNMLWTLPRPDKAIREWRRIMKPGGTLVVSDGLWMNTTWKRFHHLAFRVFRGIFRNGAMIPVRFFCTYANINKSLPFYEGLCFEDASRLLKTAAFNDIKSYDTSCFGENPYGAKNRTKKMAPPFFIAYARG